MKIGFIGQGWIGRHYADDFEKRGYAVVRYALEEPYVRNKEEIPACDIVFIAVPTPTTPQGFDDRIVRSAVRLVGKGKTAVIKSTLIPGTTESIQKENPGTFVFHSPEFLVEKTAAYDAAHPNRNIVGIPEDAASFREKAQAVLDVLPPAPYSAIMSSRDAEFVKYAGNAFLFTKVIFMNVLYDLVVAGGADWETVREGFIHDPRIGTSHTTPVGGDGRGAGGHCFIKDFEALVRLYQEKMPGDPGLHVLQALRDENIRLLMASHKDLDLLKGVYGETLPAA